MLPTIQHIRHELLPLYSADEVEALIRIIFDHVCKFTLTDLTLRRDEKLRLDQVEMINEVIRRLRKHEPIQYITGNAFFMGLTLNVTPAVLIPRPETEELAQWIADDEKLTGCALDIATGSGCLALALKQNFPSAEIWGSDISQEALDIAFLNAQNNHLAINYLCSDILAWEQFGYWKKYDLIVSNPPYVTESEQRLMQPNVLQFEPWSALFVSDQKPLIFYEAIAHFASRHLNPGGSLYLEINENFGNEVVELLHQAGFGSITLKQDMQQKARMVKAKQGNE